MCLNRTDLSAPVQQARVRNSAANDSYDQINDKPELPVTHTVSPVVFHAQLLYSRLQTPRNLKYLLFLIDKQEVRLTLNQDPPKR